MNKIDRWIGKVAVVPGASSGIGARIIVDLVNAGFVVIGLARQNKLVEQLRDQNPSEIRSRLHAIQCDVADDTKWIEADFGAIG